MMTVFLIDDSDWVRERLASAIGEIDGAQVAGGTGDPAEAPRRFKALRPDVVVLDIRLAGGNGIDILKQIKHLDPATRVIMFTNNDLLQYRTQCLDAGADYFMSKTDEFERLCELLTDLATKQKGGNRTRQEGSAEPGAPLKVPP